LDPGFLRSKRLHLSVDTPRASHNSLCPISSSANIYLLEAKLATIANQCRAPLSQLSIDELLLGIECGQTTLDIGGVYSLLGISFQGILDLEYSFSRTSWTWDRKYCLDCAVGPEYGLNLKVMVGLV
jgi:hypothetical protein